MHLRRTVLAATAALTLSLAGCAGDDLSAEDSGSGGDGGGDSGGGNVTLATQDFDEAALISAMYAAVLEDAGYTVETKAVGTRDVYMQQFPGNVDVVPEYLGGVADYLNTTQNGPDAEPVTTTDAEETLQAVQPLLEEKGIALLEPSEASSQNAYFVTQDYADENDLETLSDLEGTSVVLAAAPDCEERADCAKGLEDVYGIDVTKVLPLGFASPQTYQAVTDGEAQLGQTGTLDGTLESQGLVLLEDDQDIQPAQNLVPAVDVDFLDSHRDVQEPLEELMGALDNDVLVDLISRVTVDREQPDAVAEEWLTDEGLIG